MQNLDVISVNIWNILISLLNLLLLFWLFKKFLYKPVKKIMAERQSEIESQYQRAENAEMQANENRAQWEETLSSANEKADEIIQNATENAKNRSEALISDAKLQAERMVRQAEQDILLERKKAADDIRQEIVTVSSALAEKLLEREIQHADHRAFIDEFIEKIGDADA